MKRNASVVFLQCAIGCWLCFCFLMLSFAPACTDTGAGNDEVAVQTCDLEGVCTIKYDTANSTTLGERTCALRTEKGKTCGDCWDYQFDSDGNVTQKTCVICKLCNADFDCIEDENCPTAAPFCQQGTCVSCQSNSDCDTEKPFCIEGGCQACRKDNDCTKEALPQCEDGVCVACKCSSTDKTKPYCLKKEADQSVDCVACLKDSHCGATTPKCDTTEYVCKPFCTKDSDCASNEFCDSGKCLQCRASSDCTSAKQPLCVEGVCMCEKDSDCPAGFGKCESGNCIQCSQSSDCPEGFTRCVSGECLLQLCSESAECTNPNYGKCKRIGPNTFCVGCLQDSDCDNGKSCDTTVFLCR